MALPSEGRVPYLWDVIAGIAGLLVGGAIASIAGWDTFDAAIVTALAFQLMLELIVWVRQRRMTV